MEWSLPQPLALGDGLGTLSIERSPGEPPEGSGIDESNRTLTVRGRQPDDRLQPESSRPTRTLKAWLSQSPIPPWFRDAIPLVPGQNGLAVIGDVVLEPTLAEWLGTQGMALRWAPADPALAWAWSECRARLLGLK